MRTSILLTAVLTAPLLAIVACSPTATQKPLKGTVTEKDYKPAKTKETCPAATGKKKTAKKKKCSTVTVKEACYQLEILSDYTGEETEICDRAAYNALGEGDPYNSDVNYSKQEASK